MIKQIVADAGPLIAFSCIDQLIILENLYGHVLIPTEVANERLTDISRPGANNIKKAINRNIIKVYSQPLNSKSNSIPNFLDKGETAAIILASMHRFPLLIDEKMGRNVAKNLQLKIIGTAGTLILAKQARIISEIRPILNSFQKNGYHLSKELIKAVLKEAEEHLNETLI